MLFRSETRTVALPTLSADQIEDIYTTTWNQKLDEVMGSLHGMQSMSCQEHLACFAEVVQRETDQVPYFEPPSRHLASTCLLLLLAKVLKTKAVEYVELVERLVELVWLVLA